MSGKRLRAVREYNGLWDYMRSPFGISPDVLHATVRRNKIISAFKSVFGRSPTENEILKVANAYLENERRFSKFLRDPLFVKELQEDINKVIPNPIRVDGKFYFQTVSGIMKFQEMMGLKPTGVLNEATVSEMVNIRSGGRVEEMRKNVYHHFSFKKALLLAGGMIILYLIVRR
jgi:hypothetical protein